MMNEREESNRVSLCATYWISSKQNNFSLFAPVTVVLRRRSPVRFQIGAATVDPQARLPKIALHSIFPPIN
jgi:hypothetical protein